MTLLMLGRQFRLFFQGRHFTIFLGYPTFEVDEKKKYIAQKNRQKFLQLDPLRP